MSYFFVKVTLPAEAVPKGSLGWMPTLITYACDGALKGIGVFTTWLKADEFRTKLMEAGLSFETEIVQLGSGGMALPDFVDGVTNATRRISRTFLDTPVYVDPPDPHCREVNAVSHNNLQRFIRRCMSDELEAMCEHLSFTEYNGFTIILHRRKSDNFFGCSAFRGKFTTAEAMQTAIEDAQGTTVAKYAISTEFYSLVDTAEMRVRMEIDRLVGPENKPKIIV